MIWIRGYTRALRRAAERSESLLKASKCLEPSGRVADDLKDAWWKHVPEVKQVPVTGQVLSEDEAVISNLFSQQFSPALDVDDDEGGEEEEGEEENEGVEEDEDGGELNPPVLTQGQCDRLLRAKKWLPDKRARGIWLDEGGEVTGKLKE